MFCSPNHIFSEQEPPQSMLKLNLIADREQGWLLIVQTMIDIVPVDNPLGPAVITLFLDESPLPTKETVTKLLFLLNLSGELVRQNIHPPSWHKNLCIVLGCLSEKLAGPNSVATFHSSTLDYLIENLNPSRMPYVILHALITLEKYAQTSENKITINERLLSLDPHPIAGLEQWLHSKDYVERQVGFCAQWVLDNVFVIPERQYSYETVVTDGINVMLNNNDVSEYLKISPNGLEARCDVSSFESVRCTFPVNSGIWYYEALIVTPGVMQIGWATKNSKFLNHEGYGIGDDEYSVAYDGCRQLLWHNASSQSTNHPMWNSGMGIYNILA
ncbi:unnamed protein product [Soboliphyme baturini]|uniref:B30.2/SPRY domain-containing protein n=1 Tax=Soboliphyme baturini TaxID=241478 RepID=A0A183IN59_9BILA|nr:unnamed protein product [Soboliphyme baturini]